VLPRSRLPSWLGLTILPNFQPFGLVSVTVVPQLAEESGPPGWRRTHGSPAESLEAAAPTSTNALARNRVQTGAQPCNNHVDADHGQREGDGAGLEVHVDHVEPVVDQARAYRLGGGETGGDGADERGADGGPGELDRSPGVALSELDDGVRG